MSAAVPSLSDHTAALLRAHSGEMSTAALAALDESLPWYRALRPRERSQLGMVAQRGISSFVDWCERPTADSWAAGRIFQDTPTELTRAISLQQALQLVRVVVDSVEEYAPRAVEPAEVPSLREAVLRYSRDVAFGIADVYARAAEARGAWDTRLEALVVDAILRGENSDALRSRIAAVGFPTNKPVTIAVGTAPEDADSSAVVSIRRRMGLFASDLLVGIQGDRLILVLSGLSSQPPALTALAECFADGPVVIGPEAPSLARASLSAKAAFAGAAAARAWASAPRPVSSEDLWPERLFNGDSSAAKSLIEAIYAPLQASPGLIETLTEFIERGHSLEATSRALFVHANTVRYRLKRIMEITGWDPLRPRDVFVLHSAIIAGRLSR